MHFRVNTKGISAEAQQAVVDSIRVVPNFPKPGLFFKDLSLLLGNPAAFGSTIDALVHKYAGRGITAVVGIECRGFCFAAPVAIALKVPFVPFRKPGKLPCKSIGIDFKQSAGKHSAYFGKDRLEMHEDGLTAGSKVLVIDDLLGTGSTMFGACELVEKVGATVVECACIVEVKELAGRERVKRDIFILIEDAED
ncbi:hypothetical protein GUITHDRAFT_104910 [Guillardia theta CCMP2712]|uniref:adenine phosphoribosyltransferase n=1 Tax=Guillardia theta (strain CCMP2712) TaxID=905079 RepID=L1JMG4_GUITC|nr:hypothetical protein GUITHDRAFT_104910 [Guillardia theta CCMP2712]EKX49380.1 hypothetical protein GUITHDRAFT_104910 [Guillardia theta CCMP2712]|eukprot:XP_005836360.1 hypothetical protein GUITHDRAFT_104910 [Guillardia theta CCMP2712]